MVRERMSKDGDLRRTSVESSSTGDGWKIDRKKKHFKAGVEGMMVGEVLITAVTFCLWEGGRGEC